MKVLIIMATHGNELLGPKFLQYVVKHAPELLDNVDFIVGNPLAYKKRVRFVEADLNRSYGTDGVSYESKRAEQLLEHIVSGTYDLVVDMHTTTCVQPPCLIVGSTGHTQVRRYLRNSHIQNVLQVHSLHDIASRVEQLVAYEVRNQDITEQLLSRIASDLTDFLADKITENSKKLFRMQDKIYKKDVSPAQARTFQNFEMHELGFVPIMTGNNSYKRQTDYLGFKSGPPEEITL